jgi:hypothetical protein
MKEYPILFSSEMVRAILDGRKTMTRRVIKPQPEAHTMQVLPLGNGLYLPSWSGRNVSESPTGRPMKCPYGQPGDRLWVREAWYYEEHMYDVNAGEPDLPGGRYSRRLVYRASYPDYPVTIGVGKHGWRPSIHMPRWASRITLEIEEIRVERLQEITEEDARAEGVEALRGSFPIGEQRLTIHQHAFAYLWGSINSKKYPWDSNPYVWVIKFKRVI